MAGRAPEAVTRLLLEWRGGDQRAMDRLLPLVYDELRRLARGYMRSERPDHTLQPTALVHEAYARLVDSDISLQDRAHFLALVARSMRRILIDHARARESDKRGSGGTRVTLDEGMAGMAEAPSVSIIDLDRALERLEAEDPGRSRVIELHFFGGLTHQEIAEAMHTSESTVQRQLRLARAWLLRELGGEGGDGR